MKKYHYLVTGGAGFIGSHLVRILLKSGCQVTVLDDLSTGKSENVPAQARLIVGDTAQANIFDNLLKNIDGIFHLAAIASVERSQLEGFRAHQVNLGSMVNLLDSIQRSRRTIPVVYASSAAVYGNNTEKPISENTPTAPLSAYGADKLGCEFHARIASHLHLTPTIGLRLFNVYGPGQDPSSPYSGVISLVGKRITNGEAVNIYGDGKQSRDFVFVGEVADSFYRAMNLLHGEQTRFGILNVCTGKSTSILELTALIADIAGVQAQICHLAPRAGDIRFSQGDASLLKKMLGRAPSMPLANGLNFTLSSFSEFLLPNFNKKLGNQLNFG